MRLASSLHALLTAATLTACGAAAGNYKPPAGVDTVEQVVARLEDARTRVSSFRGSSVMDYWFGDERIKGSMLVMGAVGAKVRFNALSPAGESTMADLACDGRDFHFVDYQNNCVLSGPCNRASIAQLLRISLEPDEFLQLALGATPTLAGATGTLRWDASKGQRTVELTAAAGSQTVVLDERDGRMDVLSSELKDPSGATVWKVENADFTTVTDEAGQAHRVPGKSRLRQPQDKADLIVEWEERALNVALTAEKFQLALPAGVPTCGAKPAAAK